MDTCPPSGLHWIDLNPQDLNNLLTLEGVFLWLYFNRCVSMNTFLKCHCTDKAIQCSASQQRRNWNSTTPGCEKHSLLTPNHRGLPKFPRHKGQGISGCTTALQEPAAPWLAALFEQGTSLYLLLLPLCLLFYIKPQARASPASNTTVNWVVVSLGFYGNKL